MRILLTHSMGKMAFAVVSLGLGNCTFLVSPEDLGIKCQTEQGQDDPCATKEGLVCREGTCQICADTPEQCNGEDDDCDGYIDEIFDGDGDGHTICGALGRLVDCNDSDPNINPDEKELCDGKDNNCDGDIDEGGVCKPTGDPKCDPVLNPCPEGERCTETGMCVKLVNTGVGCSNDSDCASGMCVRREVVGMRDSPDERFCTSACCTEADCSPDDVCWVVDTGIRVCVPPSYAGREGNVRETGEECTDNQQCASGVCGDDRRCRKVCASRADCDAPGEECVFDLGALRFVCSSERPALPYGFCPQDCPSGLCIDRNTCSVPCGSNADCPENSPVCSYENAGLPAMLLSMLEGVDFFRVPVSVCVQRQAIDPAETVCCKNAHCPQGMTCRPDLRGQSWGMYCM